MANLDPHDCRMRLGECFDLAGDAAADAITPSLWQMPKGVYFGCVVCQFVFCTLHPCDLLALAVTCKQNHVLAAYSWQINSTYASLLAIYADCQARVGDTRPSLSTAGSQGLTRAAAMAILTLTSKCTAW
jgi:hypothetical protein